MAKKISCGGFEFDENNGEMTTTLRPLEERLFREFEIEFLKHRDQSLEKDFDNSFSSFDIMEDDIQF